MVLRATLICSIPSHPTTYIPTARGVYSASCAPPPSFIPKSSLSATLRDVHLSIIYS
ncbi:hypothetical protein BDN70DRAFT_888473 [Pholiota conissans]|uniref:Uncharacterized protein n=1 Tax=Pholiota conissans TaxID=109636 RepID=A0A9P5YJQ9_9AGAR|nr:hypothetical protein BDN70DRAFT_888473 [Pholiota conissans]